MEQPHKKSSMDYAFLDGEPLNPRENYERTVSPTVAIEDNTDIEVENEQGMVNTPNRHSIF